MLADAVEAGSGERFVHFTDSNNERSDVIERFLLLSSEGKLLLPRESRFKTAADLLPLLKFMEKFGCERLKPQLLLSLLELLVAHRLGPMQTLALASALDSPSLCITALEKACLAYGISSEITTPRKIEDKPLDSLVNGCPIDPGNLALSTAVLIKPEHLWALNRAWALGIKVEDRKESQGGVNVTRDLKTVVKEFKIALDCLETAPEE